MSTVTLTVSETVHYRVEIDPQTYANMSDDQLDEYVADKIASNDYAELDVIEREIAPYN